MSKRQAGGAAEPAKTTTTTPLFVIPDISPTPTIFNVSGTPPGIYIQGNSNSPDPTLKAGSIVTYGPGTFTLGADDSLTYEYAGLDTVRTTKAGAVWAAPWLPTPVSTVAQAQSTQTPSSTALPENTSPPENSISKDTSLPTPENGTPSPTSTATPKPSSSNKDVSPGTVAGVAIGCLIVGALIAALAVWFCLGRARKNRRRGPVEEGIPMPLIQAREKGPVAKALSVGSGSPMSSAIDSALPQPLEDKSISAGISAIGNAIKNHVQSFYHSSRVSPGLLDLDDLQSLGSDLPLSTGTLSTLLGNPDTREIALRFCIGWVVVSRMQLSSPPEKSFLPPQISLCLKDMAMPGGTSRSKMLFLSKWRAITAELTQATYGQNTFSTKDPRHTNIEKAVAALDGILRPYADPRMDNTQRNQNLREMFKRAATFSFTLFSQPGTFEFDWQEHHGVQSGSLCIFPALIQVTDETGEHVKPPRAFNEAITRPLGV